eukprot:4675352-Pleurochrysis_carterae.AAC.1
MVLSIVASSCNIRDRLPSYYAELGSRRLCILVRYEILEFPVQPYCCRLKDHLTAACQLLMSIKVKVWLASFARAGDLRGRHG